MACILLEVTAFQIRSFPSCPAVTRCLESPAQCMAVTLPKCPLRARLIFVAGGFRMGAKLGALARAVAPSPWSRLPDWFFWICCLRLSIFVVVWLWLLWGNEKDMMECSVGSFSVERSVKFEVRGLYCNSSIVPYWTERYPACKWKAEIVMCVCVRERWWYRSWKHKQ